MAKKKTTKKAKGRARALRSLADLKPAPFNPRKISKKAAAGLGASIGKFGDISGLVWNKRSGHLVAGHQRLEQLQLAGAKLVDGAIVVRGKTFPVRVVDWDAKTEKAANIAANNPHIAGEFDDGLGDLLSGLLEDLGEDAFAEVNLDTLRDGIASSMGVTQDEIPEPPKKAVTKLGDVWTLGRHRLMCGDSAIEHKRFKFDGVLADPPYGVSEKTKRKSAGRSKLAACNDFDRVVGDDHAFDPSPWVGFRPCVLFGANHFSDRLPPSASWLIWDKRDGAGSDDNADCELAWSNIGGPARVFRHLWKGMIKASERRSKRVHPTQKPVALMAWCLERMGSGAVLDPFAGSGPTLIAAEQIERKCFSVEIDPRYCDVIIERWSNLTGGKPRRTTRGRA